MLHYRSQSVQPATIIIIIIIIIINIIIIIITIIIIIHEYLYRIGTSV